MGTGYGSPLLTSTLFSILSHYHGRHMVMTEDRGIVLVVDDDQEMRELMRDVLQEHGHRVTVAANGRFFLGSVSTKVAQHSTCSVLVVR